jgi:hypothetical protein
MRAVLKLAPSRPTLDEQTVCDSFRAGLHLEIQSVSEAADGAVFVAGRCQNMSKAGLRPPKVIVLRWVPRGAAWEIFEAPDTQRFDYILAVGVYARSRDEAYLTLSEPYAHGGEVYLARFAPATERRAFVKDSPPSKAPIDLLGEGPRGELCASDGQDIFLRSAGGTWQRAHE